MSIINDALKKLQAQISNSNPSALEGRNAGQSTPLTAAQQAGFEPVASLYSSPKPSQQRPTEKTGESKLVIILGLPCLLTALFAPIVNKQSVMSMLLAKIPKKTNTITIAQSIPTTLNTAPVVHTAAEPEKKQEPIQQIVKKLTAPISKPQANAPSRLIINGIMTHGEKNLALIDGQVYEEGDEVDGIKLLKITPKGVTVLENGIERPVKVMGQ